MRGRGLLEGRARGGSDGSNEVQGTTREGMKGVIENEGGGGGGGGALLVAEEP